MARKLSGSLSDLGPKTVLRLLSVTQPSGVLDLDTDAGSLSLSVTRGKVAEPTPEEEQHFRQIFAATSGEFRFEPGEAGEDPEKSITLGDLLEMLRAGSDRVASFASDLDVDSLLADQIEDQRTVAQIHLLSVDTPDNPIEDLLADLEANAPEELLFAQVGVVTLDPRPWRGTLEATWRRRGWELHLFGAPGEVVADGLDVLVVHHRLSVSRAGHEGEWTALVERVAQQVPVIWIGPLGDTVWVHRLIHAGVSFLMPPPQGEGGEAWQSFQSAVTTVVDRQLALAARADAKEVSVAVGQLVDSLLRDTGPEQGLGLLLQVAAGVFQRGAVLAVEGTCVRCRAGFGYPLSPGSAVLPRGVGLIERVIRSREEVIGLDAGSGGALQLARVLGLTALPESTAILPLCAGASVVGCLVGDADGQRLPDLGELSLLARRIGGIVFND